MTDREKEISRKMGKRSTPQGNKGLSKSTILPKSVLAKRKKESDEICRMSEHPYRRREGTKNYPVGIAPQFCMATVQAAKGLQSIEDYMKSKEYKDSLKHNAKILKGNKSKNHVPMTKKTFDYWTQKL
jgi:hypothetical protein